jgi:ribosomal protein S18 acetylase RimI-like enzyme
MPALDIVLRHARFADARALAAVHEAAWLEAYRGIIPGRHLAKMIARRGPAWWENLIERRSQLLMLEVADAVAGYVHFGPARSLGWGLHGEIFELYVDPVHQGLGFGRRLFDAAREALERQGHRNLVVWALAENERACRFYVRLGGRGKARVRDRYEGRLVERVAFLWDER